MHVLVRNRPYIDRPEVVCDIAHGLGLGLVRGFADALCPEIPLTSYVLEVSISPYHFGSSASTSSRWKRSNGIVHWQHLHTHCRD